MWAGSLSHNGLLGCGMEEDWASHQLEHELSAHVRCGPWGRSGGSVGELGPLCVPGKAGALCPVCRECDGASRGLQPSGAERPIDIRIEEFFRQIQMPTSIHEMGIELTEEQIGILAEKCSFDNTRTIGGFRVLNREDMAEIYRMAR